MALNTKPYPPIVDTWTAPTVYSESIKIYFTLSAYSSLAEINQNLVLVDIRAINSGKNKVKAEQIGGNSYICNLNYSEDGKNYYVEIPTTNSDYLNFTEDDIGAIFKIQLRFCSSTISCVKEDFYKYYYDYLNSGYISEYSSIVLAKLISKPFLSLREFGRSDVNSLYVLYSPSLDILGTIEFENGTDFDESLASYQISLYENLSSEATDQDTLIIQSDWLYPDIREINQIHYLIKRELKNNCSYLLKISFTTSSGYEDTQEYHFVVSYDYEVDSYPPVVVSELDKENATVNVTIHSVTDRSEGHRYKGWYILRRTDSLSDFQDWEDLKYLKHEDLDLFDTVVRDYLVQSGVIYKYQVIPISINGHRGLWKSNCPDSPINTSTGEALQGYWDEDAQEWYFNSNNGEEEGRVSFSQILCDFEDIHLIGDSLNQYCIRHDSSISSFQYTVLESKTDTLGNQYPFIRRNGDTYYRQFPIQGLITHFDWADTAEENYYTNIKKYTDYYYDKIEDYADRTHNEENKPIQETIEKKRLKYVGKNKEIMNIFNKDYYNRENINGYNDIFLEKEYRDSEIDFLYSNRIRLFKSPTEGNILVKLMNITLTPNNTIKRLVSSFQCTAFEVDKFNLENCILYEIWDDNKQNFIDDQLSPDYSTFVGQLRINKNKYEDTRGIFSETDLYDLIKKDVLTHLNNKYAIVDKVIWLKTQFDSAPSYFGSLGDGKVGLAFLNQGDYSTNSYNIVYDGRNYNNTLEMLDEGEDLFAAMGGNSDYIIKQLQALSFLTVSYVSSAPTLSIPPSQWSNTQKEKYIEILSNETNGLQPHIGLNENSTSMTFFEEEDNDILRLQQKLAILITNIIREAGCDFEAFGFWLQNQKLLDTEKNILLSAMEEIGYSFSIKIGSSFQQLADSLSWQGYFDGVINGENSNVAQSIIVFFINLAAILPLYGIDWGTAKTDTNFSNDGTFSVVKSSDSKGNLLKTASVNAVISGYELQVNNKSIIIPNQGYYELIDKDTEITQLMTRRLRDESLQCNIDYAVMYHEIPHELNQMRSSRQYYLVGQIRTISLNEEVISTIKLKYDNNISYDNNETIERKVISVPYISIEGEPYTQLLIKDSDDTDAQTHIINETGVLTLYEPNSDIKELRIVLSEDENEIFEGNEKMYDGNHAQNDILINYICLVRETRYV